MKHPLRLLVFFFLFTFSIQGQTLLDTIRTNIETKIVNLDKSKISTNILYDRTLPLAELTKYGTLEGGLIFPIQTLSTNSTHYFQALEDLNHTDYLNRYPDAETTYNNNELVSGYYNIGVINADLNTFKSNAVDVGALLVQGQDSLLYDNPSSNVSPYLTYRNVFIATPLKQNIYTLNPIFKFEHEYWTETAQNPIQNLEIDFGDGKGYVSILRKKSITINYNSYGKKEIKFKATFYNNKTKVIKSSINILLYSIPNPLSNSNNILEANGFSDTLTFDSEIHTFKGYDETQAYKGKGRYQKHTTNSLLEKPIILVEGYDPNDKNGNQTLYNIFNENYLGYRLTNDNYDIISLNFEPRVINGKTVKGGTDYIERNAMVLVKLIEIINAEKEVNAEPTKIIGFSMGGLVARYALRYMELNNIEHDVDLYISVDTPHQGANVPAGVQHTIKLIDDLVPTWLSKELGNMESELNYPATRQMLKYHYNGNSFYNTFYNNLNAMGYPQNTRNIAIANGSLIGNGINNINQKYYDGSAYIASFLFSNGKLRLNFTHNSGSARVFYWNLKTLNISVHKRQFSIITDPALGSLENAPAGYVSLDDLNEKVLDITNMKFNWLIAGMSQKLTSEKFSFIPTKSALDFQGNTNLYQNIYSNLVCSGNTPFDSYFANPATNESHMFLSLDSSNFLYEEITGNEQYPPHDFFLPGGSYYFVEMGSYTDLQLTNNPLPGKPAFPQTFPQKVDVHQVLSLGSTPISWTLFSDNQNAVESWSFSNNNLSFKYRAHKTDAEILFKSTFKDECGIIRNAVYSFIILQPELNLNSLNEDYTIYPVPADNELNIIRNFEEEENITTHIKFYDMNGVKVKEDTFNNTELKINVSELNNGLYFLKIINTHQEIVKQIAIQH